MSSAFVLDAAFVSPPTEKPSPRRLRSNNSNRSLVAIANIESLITLLLVALDCPI